MTTNPKKTKKSKGGRPSKFNSACCEQVEKLCKLGATDPEIADFFGVTVSTISNWKHEHPDFLEALKNGKEIADIEVASKLHGRAIGYRYIEQQAFKLKVGTNQEEVKIVDIEKEVPPDPTSCIFWLKNRRKQDWRDKSETHNTEEINVKVSVIDEFRSRIVGISARGGEGQTPQLINGRASRTTDV